MKCDDCENYKAKRTGWRGCYFSPCTTYSNDGNAGRDDLRFPRLKYFVRGYYNDGLQTRAGFLTREDAELFLAALPEEEK